jgi:hypothetical protein
MVSRVIPTPPASAPREQQVQQGQHRRVGGHDVNGASLVDAAHEPIEGFAEIRLGPCLYPGVLEAQCHVGGTRPGRAEPMLGGGQFLDARVPQPRDVPAVGDLVVDRDQDVGLGQPGEQSDRLVQTGRVLDEDHDHATAPILDHLPPAERSLHALEGATDGRRGDAEAQSGGVRRGRVVGVVGAGDAQPHRHPRVAVSEGHGLAHRLVRRRLEDLDL